MASKSFAAEHFLGQYASLDHVVDAVERRGASQPSQVFTPTCLVHPNWNASVFSRAAGDVQIAKYSPEVMHGKRHDRR